jgi:hypothetical protein
MARDLSRISGKDYALIIHSETGSIVKIAALRSRVASLAKIKRDVQAKAGHRFHEPGGSSVAIVNWKRDEGRTWFAYSEAGGRIRNVGAYMVYDAGKAKGHHLPDSVWQDYLALLGYEMDYVKQRTKELARRRGLQRLSWLQIGDAIGIVFAAISPSGNLSEAVVRGSRGPGGRTYQNGTAKPTVSGSKYAISITNVSPLAVKNGGQATLNAAINQRVKGFEIALAKGVLFDLKARSSRWKGIFVSQG